MKCKGIIFDLDGTLLNTLKTIAYYCNAALEKYGIVPYAEEKFKYMVGNGAKNLVHRMLEGRNIKDEDTFQKVYTHYNDIYNSNTTYLTEIYPGIPALLETIRDAGMKAAVLSNKPQAATVPIIKSIFGEDTFEAVYGGREGVPLKPDPTAALAIAKELDVEPSACLYVGDTSVDMQTGKNAGFYTIGVLWGFRTRQELEEAKADMIAESPADIEKLIREA